METRELSAACVDFLTLTGSAEILYTRRSDAFGAFKKYNNVLLDGKPMKIEIVGANPVEGIKTFSFSTGKLAFYSYLLTGCLAGVLANMKIASFTLCQSLETVICLKVPGLGGGRGAAVNNRGFGVHSRHQGGGDISTGTRNGRGRAPGRGRGRGRGRGKNQPGE
ncbi:hypothetical protein OIU78_018119, partial [Salix suchowensis]